jgi:hypothetical protein
MFFLQSSLAHNEQFEQLLLETDITVGVARRVLEKRHDLKNRAFNDLKKSAEKKCIELVRQCRGCALYVMLWGRSRISCSGGI